MEFLAGDFHQEPRRVYQGDLDWAVYKDSQQMVQVVYQPAHLNDRQKGPPQGQGRLRSRWIFSEEPGTKEGLFSSGLELVIDSYLEPHASVGLHTHSTTEEIYYLLEGSLWVTTIASNGESLQEKLMPGDAHAIRVGQSHWAQAGEKGARFMTIAARVVCSEG